MPLERSHLKHSLERYQKRDPDLYDELSRKLVAPTEEAVAGTARAISAHARPLLEAGRLSATGRRVIEAIVRPSARPVLVVRDGRATTEFLGPDSQVWADRIRSAQTILDQAIPAVGRVEVSNNPDFAWIGTGWLVADDIVVTNRHVARCFARRDGTLFVFRVGANGALMSSRVDFLEEDQRVKSLEYAVRSVLWIASSIEPDVAFLRIARISDGRPLPPAIPLATSVNDADYIVTIGYPARDPSVPDQDLVLRTFGDVYDKKRLAPGQVMDVGTDEMTHDCSTLGGNSGSVVLNLRTGEAMGLHFAGSYLEANYAVPSPRVAELLRRLQRGELASPVAVPTPSQGPGVPTVPSPPAAAQVQPCGTSLQFNIPIEITVKVGGQVIIPGLPALPAAVSSSPLGPPPAATGMADHHESALRAARAALAGNPDVLAVRPGYRFKGGWITNERAIVVEVREKRPLSALQAEKKPLIPSQFLGVGVDVRTGSFFRQLESLGFDLAVLEARPRPGRYREPPDLSLDVVHEPMSAIFHVSPDSGFPNLRAFLGRVQHTLIATMFEWEPNHVSDAIEQALSPAGRRLKMVTQRRGTEDAVRKMKSTLGEKFDHVWASVGADMLIPNSYHIKVASRDGEELWLSSGNWKDSGQPDIDPAGEDSTEVRHLRRHNREWHAIIRNRSLAELFQKYIEYDFDEAQRVPVEEAIRVPLPDLFLPEEAFAEAFERIPAVKYFDPLVIENRPIDIQPLLTPDRDSRGRRVFMAHATKMIKQATQKIYVENQSFAFLEENVDDFEDFFVVLREKQRAGLDVRIIFRDAREFGGNNASDQQNLLERIKDFGLDTDLIKVQKRCHTKGIITDSREVMLGSHNLTNSGSLFNRDASLLVRDPEVAQYFEKVFLFDWEFLATQDTDELVGGMRIAHPGEETLRGFRRVSLAELLGDS